MVSLKDLRRAEARRRRVIERLGIEQRERLKTIRINTAIDQLRLVVADESFRQLLHADGTLSLPAILTSEMRERSIALDASLDFLIAWRFISPLLYNPQIGAFLEARWPRLTIELRDIFIALVADGPFPYEERGRPPRRM